MVGSPTHACITWSGSKCGISRHWAVQLKSVQADFELPRCYIPTEHMEV